MASMAFCVAAATSVAIILACCLHGHADAQSVVPSRGTTMPSHREDHQAAAEDSCMVRWLSLIPAVTDARQVESVFKLFSKPVDEANIATISPLQLVAGLGSKSSANHFTSCLADKTSACHSHAPCQNGGMCRYSESPATPTPSYHCVCPDGFTGNFCQEQQPSCSGNPCQNGGTCQGNITAYQCHCPQHFSGTHCEHEWLDENKFLAVKSAISEVGVEMRIFKAQALEERKQDVQHLDSFLQRLEQRLVSKLNESLAVIKSNVTSLSKNIDSLKKSVDPSKCRRSSLQVSSTFTFQSVSVTGAESVNITAYCDRHTDGGGWIVFQRRQDGSVDFYRDWSAYKRGFGSVTGDFWLGLENIHTLTSLDSVGGWELRIDMTFSSGQKHFAKYSRFSVGSEADKYRLHVSGFSSPTLQDSLNYHNNQAFTTRDRDNDLYGSVNCAQYYKGAWWYESCFHSNLNGVYDGSGTPLGLVWHHAGTHQPLTFVEMKMRRRS